MRTSNRNLVLVPLLTLCLVAATGCGGGATSPPDRASDAAPETSADPPADVVSPDDAADHVRPTPDGASGDHTAPPAEPWRVGAAARVVTPRDAVVMGGYGVYAGGIENCRWTEGVHDDTWATAFAVEDAWSGAFVVFASVDIVGLMRPDVAAIQAAFVAEVREASGQEVAADALVVSGSHAHATPDSVGIWGSTPGESGRDPAYMTRLVDDVAGVAAAAYLGRVPASLEVGTTWLDNALDVVSETEPMEQDGRMTVLAGRAVEDGALIGTLTVWGGHPTLYGIENNALSADWVGVFRRRMNDALGEGVHAHVQGAVGGVYTAESGCEAVENPFDDGWADPDVPAALHRLVACAGGQVAAAAQEALAAAAPLPRGAVDVRSVTYPIPVTNEVYFLLSEWEMLPRPIRRGEAVESVTTVARVGHLTFVTAPGEAFPRYAAALREAVADAGDADPEDVVVIGLGNDWLGYLLTRAQHADPAYGYHRGLSPSADALEAHLSALKAAVSR